MKKVLSILSLLSVILVTGCSSLKQSNSESSSSSSNSQVDCKFNSTGRVYCNKLEKCVEPFAFKDHNFNSPQEFLTKGCNTPLPFSYSSKKNQNSKQKSCYSSHKYMCSNAGKNDGQCLESLNSSNCPVS